MNTHTYTVHTVYTHTLSHIYTRYDHTQTHTHTPKHTHTLSHIYTRYDHLQHHTTPTPTPHQHKTSTPTPHQFNSIQFNFIYIAPKQSNSLKAPLQRALDLKPPRLEHSTLLRSWLISQAVIRDRFKP